jgi:hypothetical protein
VTLAHPPATTPPPPGFRLATPPATDVDVCHEAVLAVDRHDLCIPPEVKVGQMVDVVVKYVDARSYRGHEPFSVLIREVLAAAWPCRR